MLVLWNQWNIWAEMLNMQLELNVSGVSGEGFGRELIFWELSCVWHYYVPSLTKSYKKVVWLSHLTDDKPDDWRGGETCTKLLNSKGGRI